MNKLLSISTDRSLFKEGSAVRQRFQSYAKEWGEIHIIVATRGNEFGPTSIAPNVWVYPTRSVAKIFYPLSAIRLGRFIIQKRGITNITCQDPFLTALAGVKLKKETGLPLEIQIHTDIGSPNFTYTAGNKIRKSLALSYLPKADRIRVVSSRVREYLISSLAIDPAKIEVRPIAVDADAVRQAPVTADLHVRYPKFKKIILVAARLEPEKALHLAVDAFEEVSSHVQDVGLVIVGSGSCGPELRRKAAQSAAAKQIMFEPWVDRPTLFSYYKTADVFLSTSLFEGYGMTLVEAKAAGCPIVSTDVGVAREVGAAIVSWDPSDIADGIERSLALK